MHGLGSLTPVVKPVEQIRAIDVAKEISLEKSPELVRLSLLKLDLERPNEWTYRALRYALQRHQQSPVFDLALDHLRTLSRLESDQTNIVNTLGYALLGTESSITRDKILSFGTERGLQAALIPFVAASFSEVSTIEFLELVQFVCGQQSPSFEVLPVIYDALIAHGITHTSRVEQQMSQNELLNWRSLDTVDANSAPRIASFLEAMRSILENRKRFNDYQDRTLARIMLTAPQLEQRREAASYLFRGKSAAELNRLSPVIFYGLNRIGHSLMHEPDMKLARVVDDFLLAALRDMHAEAEVALPLIDQVVRRSVLDLNVRTMAQELQVCLYSAHSELAFESLASHSAVPAQEDTPFITFRSLVYISANGPEDLAVQAKRRVETLLLIGSDLPRLREGLTMLISREPRLSATFLDLLCELARRGVDQQADQLSGALALHALHGIKRAMDFYPAGSEHKYKSFVSWFKERRKFYFPHEKID